MFRYSILSSLKIRVASSLLFLALVGCQPTKEEVNEVQKDLNPPAEGFNLAQSDSLAMQWADATMQAMGGRDTWDATRFISWNFFGRRDLLWDKYSGDVRIESPTDSIKFFVNIKTDSGRVQIRGKEVMDQDSLKTLLDRAKRIWINDSYWLVMPFKLKDSGVTLKYLGENTIASGAPAHVLELTFAEVGVTPNNKYEVFITKSDSLVKQWAYFGNAEQDSASAIWPWDNYKEYNGLLLSANRSDNLGPKNVKVLDSISDQAFIDFEWELE